ncbi:MULTISPECIES: hypothetical protein [Cysteiniphilum]|uniref:Uncharacterized protein n=1 Tax=Cysteiniphilum litorale TaxID=2056700 RepID=A0A8J2Z3V7_9GAMM|nr:MULTISPECIES: hypothetical protein [Cysteiniphilum]GGF93257.1 hypothetical protein GCM10010995_07970 [Cysteiniphilum litorale]
MDVTQQLQQAKINNSKVTVTIIGDKIFSGKVINIARNHVKIETSHNSEVSLWIESISDFQVSNEHNSEAIDD